MSTIIDMEMPKYCTDCPMQNSANSTCNFSGDTVYGKRPFDCPLHESKHGNWEFRIREGIFDDGEFGIMAYACCPCCGREYMGGKEICAQDTNYYWDHNDNEPIPNNVIEEARQKFFRNLDRVEVEANYCPHCGAFLKDGITPTYDAKKVVISASD